MNKVKKFLCFWLALIFTISNLKKIGFAAPEDHFYLSFNIDNLPYTQQYSSCMYVLRKENYTEDELENLILEFFAIFSDDPNLSMLLKGEPSTGREIVWAGENSGGWMYDDPYLYGARDLWYEFNAEDRYGKTRYKDAYGISQATNDAIFNNMDIPQARTNPVALVIQESGVWYHIDGRPYDFNNLFDNYGWAVREDHGSFFYIYIPDENAGNDTENTVHTVYRPRKAPFPEPRPYPTGTLPYTCMDPVDAVTGSFLWNYTDLKIAGKHQMNFSRVYDNQSDIPSTGILGKNWSHSYDYRLEADDKNAYFILPTGEGIPFTFDETTNSFTPSGSVQTGYSMGYVNSSNSLVMGANQMVASTAFSTRNNASNSPSGYIVKGYIGPKYTQTNADDSINLDINISITSDEAFTVSTMSAMPATDLAENAITLDSLFTTQPPLYSNEMTFTADDGTEMILTYEKEPYGETELPIQAFSAFSPFSTSINSGFNPSGKSYVIRHEDGTEYHFDSEKRITKIVQDGVTKYTYEYNSDKIKITGQYGAYFELTVNNGKVVSVNDYTENTVSYEYNNKG